MKKAFTLAELLIVVLVLGVLATVSVPKMKKVLETRKTTEAENMLTALRTEQEKRCTMGKDYLTDKNQLPVLAQADQSKNYTYQLTSMGANAVSKTGGYTIQMPSYRDGALCCDDCDGLNKDYPSCGPLPNDDECANPIPCSAGGGTKSCGCAGKGKLTATCDGNTGTWNYGACSIADECTCADTPKPTETTRPCGKCGTQTATITCNQSTDIWNVTWSACSEPTLQTQTCGCENKGTQTQVCDTVTGQLNWGECSVSEECEATCETPAFNLSVGGYDWTNDGLCCENGKMMDYCNGATYCDSDSWTTTPIEASAELQESYCCGDVYIRCRAEWSDVEFSSLYKYKKTCEPSMGEIFVGYSCSWAPDSGNDNSGEEEDPSEETCSGTHTIVGDGGNYALADCKLESQYTCADISTIDTKGCNCTVNVSSSSNKHPVTGELSSPGNACWVKGTYTLSK